MKAMCSTVVCCNSIVCCNSVSAGRSGMAASKFLAAAAAGVVLMCFAAENRKSHCSGGVRVANGTLAAIFSNLALMIFLSKFLLKSGSKSSLFRFGVECNLCSGGA